MVRPSLEGGDFLLLIEHELRRLYSYSSGNFQRRRFLIKSKQSRVSMVRLNRALSESALRRAVRSRRPRAQAVTSQIQLQPVISLTEVLVEFTRPAATKPHTHS